jgi:hypothetical protein
MQPTIAAVIETLKRVVKDRLPKSLLIETFAFISSRKPIVFIIVIQFFGFWLSKISNTNEFTLVFLNGVPGWRLERNTLLDNVQGIRCVGAGNPGECWRTERADVVRGETRTSVAQTNAAYVIIELT